MCGIVGITHSETASLDVFQGMLLLQHRGQDSAGILSYNADSKRFHLKKGLGLTTQVFTQQNLAELEGNSAIGHTRYSTVGKIYESDIQPLLENYPYGVGAVHNGNVSNTEVLKKRVFATERYLSSNNDLEILIHLLGLGLTDGLQKNSTDFFSVLVKSVQEIFNSCEGGYSFVSLIAKKGMVVFCDPYGIRPLIMGKKGESTIFCSETNVLNFLGYEFVRDVYPGEVIWIDEDNKFHSEVLSKYKAKPCMFEWVYFSNAESTWHGKNMYQVRLDLGRLLGEKIKALNLEIDLVAPVPDTSRSAAIALSEVIERPYREILMKNRYVQRSFIMNTQDKRREAVNLKFAVVKEFVKGKKILLVDDSIVRGTTSEKIIELLHHYGAEKVYFASTCPPIKFPCTYGIAFPKKEELMSNGLNVAEMSASLGADNIFFTDLNDLKIALGNENFCHGCLTGDYPYDRLATTI